MSLCLEQRSGYPDNQPEQYQHEIVRDLSWLIHSQSLMQLPDNLQPDWLFNDNQVSDKLAELDQNPQKLISGLRQQAHFRLGYYFEDLVRMYLKYFIQPLDLKSNIQVFHDKSTVGEYDFLMQLKDGQKIHLETAVKFYLCTCGDENICQTNHFVGPNRSDRLDKKWQRLMAHQLNLSRTEAGNDQAEAINLVPDQRTLLLRGYLFYPYSHWQTCQADVPVNPDHARGWWLRSSDSEVLEDNYRYTILMKPCWLAPARANFQKSLSFKELLEITTHITTPLLIARLSYNEGDCYWHESDRGFMVPDNWNLQP